MPGVASLVLLSGMLGDHTLWDEVSRELADVAQPCPLRIDRDDTIRAMATSVLREAPARFAVAGHSLGGIVALELLRQAPGRVAALALLNTSAWPATAAQLAAWSVMTDRSGDGQFADVAAELARHTLPEPHRGDEMVARNAAMATTVGPDGFLLQLAAQASRPDARPLLRTLTVPTLVVAGALDEVCPPVRQEELAADIPGARLVVVEDAGHMSPLESPHGVARAMRSWLTDRTD